MTSENFNELADSSVDKVLKQVDEYMRLLKSGISYEELIALYEMDKKIYSNKKKMNEVFDLLSPIDIDFDDRKNNKEIIEAYEKICIWENDVHNMQTNITSNEDIRDMLLAIRLAYGLLNEELKEKEEKSLKMINKKSVS